MDEATSQTDSLGEVMDNAETKRTDVDEGHTYGPTNEKEQESEPHDKDGQKCELDESEGQKREPYQGEDGNRDVPEVKLSRQTFAGDVGSGDFCFTKKCIPCHRCSGNMRLCMRRVKYRNTVKNYPTYRCVRKQCQTFCSPRTLTRRLRNVAYDKLSNRQQRDEITPQAKHQLMAAFGTCLVHTADGSHTTYSTEKAKLARDKLALRAVSETTVLLRAMLADGSCTISSHLKTAIGNLSALLPTFSNIPTNAVESHEPKLKRKGGVVNTKGSVVPPTQSKDSEDTRMCVDGAPSNLPELLAAAMDRAFERSPSPSWNEPRDERSDSASILSGTDTSSSLGARKDLASREDVRSWVKVSKFSSAFSVTFVRNWFWEVNDAHQNEGIAETNTVTYPANNVVCDNNPTSNEAICDSSTGYIDAPIESTAHEVFRAIVL